MIKVTYISSLLLLVLSSVVMGIKNMVVPISKRSDFIYPLETKLPNGKYLEIYAQLPLRMHEDNEGHEICCILEQSELVDLTPDNNSNNNNKYNSVNYDDDSDSDYDSSNSGSDGYNNSNMSATATQEEIWLPLQTVFCNSMYYNGKQEVFKSLKMDNFERWDGSDGVGHRLRFTSGCDEVVSVSITLRQSYLSGSTQETLALVLLLLTCLTLCVDKACRSNVLFISCLIAFLLLGVSGKFPSSDTVISWIDAGTILVKMSSNFFISSLNGTGLHEWVAYKLLCLSRWRPRYLAFWVWIFTGLTAVFLPGMATVYLVTKITLLACKDMKINPIPVILGQMIMINIGSVGSTVDPAMLIIIKYFDLPPYQTLYIPLVYSLICGVVAAAALVLFYTRELSAEPVKYNESAHSPPSYSFSPRINPDSELELASDSTASTPMISQRFSHTSIPAIELASLSSTEPRRRSRLESPEGKVTDTPGMENDIDSNENVLFNVSDSNSSVPSSLQGSPIFSSTRPAPANEDESSPNSLRWSGAYGSGDANSPRFANFSSPGLTSSSGDTEVFSKPSEIKEKDRVFWVLAIVVALNIYSLIFTIVGFDFPLFMVLLSSLYAVYLDIKKAEVIYEFFPLENLLLISLSFVFIGALNSLGLSRLTCKYHYYFYKYQYYS